jgi:hypothetical protein
MENKDKQSLQAIQHSKYVSHNDWLFVQIQKSECPGKSEQEHKHDGSSQPRSAKQTQTYTNPSTAKRDM